jgi:hypothetical protein
MRLDEISTKFDSEKELIEQLGNQRAIEVDRIFAKIKYLTNDFTDKFQGNQSARNTVVTIGMKLFLHRTEISTTLGNNSNALQKINIVLDYIQNLK